MSFVIWMTGLPCSGKTTLAKKLQENLINLEILDGDNLMDDLVAGTGSLSNGTQTGWSKQGRLDHTKRVAPRGSYHCNVQSIPSISNPSHHHIVHNFLGFIEEVKQSCSQDAQFKKRTMGSHKNCGNSDIALHYFQHSLYSYCWIRDDTCPGRFRTKC